MSGTPQVSSTPHRQSRVHRTALSRSQRASLTTFSIFVLSLLFFVTGISAGIMYRRLDIDPVWVLLMVPFSFGMTGSLVLFNFLHSSATIENNVYKVGGALAGFIVLFGIFYQVTKGPFLEELDWYKVNSSHLSDKLLSMTYAYNKIEALKSNPISNIANESIETLNTNLSQLAKGTYTINANELWFYLEPLITKAKSKYYATQYVLPKNFGINIGQQIISI